LQLSKILEKILHTRVYAYSQDFNLLSNDQYGFRPKSATAFAVENIYSNLLINRENGLYTCSIFLDISKAFDTVNQGCATMQHCRANAHNQIGPRATAACVKLCSLDNLLATHGRLVIPF